MNTRFLTLLTTLAFLGFTVSAFAVKFGAPYPTFDVDFNGVLDGGYGSSWQSGKKQEGLTYWDSDPKDGDGYIGLAYFEAYFSSLPDGTTDCFDPFPTLINGVQFFRNRDDAAVLKISFEGRERFGTMPMDFMYLLTLEGDFAPGTGTWLPQDSTTVDVVSWELILKKKRENNLYSEVSCVGSGDFDAAASILVTRNTP